MVFWGQIQNYMMRMNLTLLIVAMIKKTPNLVEQSDNATVACDQILMVEEAQQANPDGDFEWDEFQKGFAIFLLKK